MAFPQARLGFFAHALQHQRLEGPGGLLERLSRIAERADAHALVGSLAAGRGLIPCGTPDGGQAPARFSVVASGPDGPIRVVVSPVRRRCGL